MSTHDVRQRTGMGPSFDSHFEARAGRRAAAPEDWPRERALASGYIELRGERPAQDLLSILETMYLSRTGGAGRKPTAARESDYGPPYAQGLVAEIRYLITDPGCGIAIPMLDFMPRGEITFRSGIERFEVLTRGRLAAASSIDLLVVFNFNAIGPMLRRALWPQMPYPAFGSYSPRERSADHKASERPNAVEPFELLVARALSKRPLGAYKVGLAPRCRPQLAKAVRQLGPSSTSISGGASDYGIQETGSNSIIGIVDFGCDFAHPSFRFGPQGQNSRILEI